MKLSTIKSAKETGIPGIEFVFTDKAITEVIIGKVHIRKGESYSAALQLLIETPFDEDKRFRATATIEGFDPKISYFDDRYSADQFAQSMIAKGAEASVEQVTAMIDDSGDVVGVVGDPAPVAANEFEVPF